MFNIFCKFQNSLKNEKTFLKTHSLLEIVYSTTKTRCDSSNKTQHGMIIYDRYLLKAIKALKYSRSSKDICKL